LRASRCSPLSHRTPQRLTGTAGFNIALLFSRHLAHGRALSALLLRPAFRKGPRMLALTISAPVTYASGRMFDLRYPQRIVVASFFSGIGGFDLGFERCGMHIGFQCEKDPFCLDVLKTHWPSVPRAEDVDDVESADVPFSQVWCAGFPCQDLSLADPRGRAGLKGRRSGLFHRFARTLGETRPAVVILENVPGLLNSNKGKDFEVVIRSLVELGYGVGWRIVNSRYFGVPQWRRRLFIVGYHRDPQGAAEILFEPECGEWNPKAGKETRTAPFSPFTASAGDSRKGPVVPENSYCLSATTGRHTGNDWSRTYVSYPIRGRVRRLTPRECEALQGFPPEWTIPTGYTVDRIARSESKRYAALGNAVTVPVARWLGARIVAAMQRKMLPAGTSSLGRREIPVHAGTANI
jgi:DNA (cytosine-5)-methyltransferase 1